MNEHITVHVSKSRWPGRVYYRDTNTGQTSWTLSTFQNDVKTEEVHSEPSHSTVSTVPRGLNAPSPPISQPRTLCSNCNRVVSSSPCNSVKDVVMLLTPHGISGTAICTCQVRGRMLVVLDRLVQAAEEYERVSDLEDFDPTSVFDWTERRISEPDVRSLESFGFDSSEFSPVWGEPRKKLRVASQNGNKDSITCQEDKDLVSFFKLEANTHPTISLTDYLNRLWRYCRVSDATFLVSLVLLLRLYKGGGLILNSRTVHKALLSAVIVAAKINEDATLSNRSFAVVGGISVGEINKLELAMCRLLRWRLDVSIGEWVAAASVLF